MDQYRVVCFLLLSSLLPITGCGDHQKKVARRVFIHDSDEAESKNIQGIHALSGWSEKPVVLQFREGTSDVIRDGIKRAAQTWNNAVGFELLTFSNISANRYKGDLLGRLKEQSAIDVENHWCRTSKGKQVLGTTIWKNTSDNIDLIERGSITLNGQNYLLADATKSKSLSHQEVVDVESLALHEIGHIIGLSHIYSLQQNMSVMEPGLSIGEGYTTRKLYPGDIERIRYIYVPNSPRPSDISSYQPQRDKEPEPTDPQQPTPNPTACDFTSD